MLSIIFREYFYLRQTLPIFLYVFYIHFRDEDNPIIERVVKTGLLAIGLVTVFFSLGYIMDIPFNELIPFTWSYPGPITWGVLFIIYFYILALKGQSGLTSFTLATMATVGGGWLYEIPLFHPITMFLTRSSIFYLNGQIMCLLILVYDLMRKGLKPNMLMGTTLILFLLVSTILVIKDGRWPPYSGIWLRWIERVPASLLLISLLSGIEKRDDEK